MPPLIPPRRISSMNGHDQKSLSRALKGRLPDGFTPICVDDFVNYQQKGPNRDTLLATSCRVIRVVGKGRHLVLFHYSRDALHLRPQFVCGTLFLHSNGKLIPFEPDLVLRDHRREKPGVTWERAVGEWLDGNGAQNFKGHNWSEFCAGSILHMITRWQESYSGGTWAHSETSNFSQTAVLLQQPKRS